MTHRHGLSRQKQTHHTRRVHDAGSWRCAGGWLATETAKGTKARAATELAVRRREILERSPRPWGGMWLNESMVCQGHAIDRSSHRAYAEKQQRT